MKTKKQSTYTLDDNNIVVVMMIIALVDLVVIFFFFVFWGFSRPRGRKNKKKLVEIRRRIQKSTLFLPS